LTDPEIVYITAWGRSGTTLVGAILGSRAGVFDAGELWRFWTNTSNPQHFCGCGRPSVECPFWSEVRELMLDDDEMPTKDLAEVATWQREATRWRRVLAVSRAGSLDELSDVPYRKYVAGMRCLYRAVATASGASTVVDSSKKVGVGALARFAAPRRARYVHMLRDPRATAFSWARRRAADPGNTRSMPRYDAFASSVNWVMSNLAADRLRRAVPDGWAVLRYEDFVLDPRGTISSLLEELGAGHGGADEPGATSGDVPFVGDRTVILAPGHSFAGNPARFRAGQVDIASDDEWLRRQRWVDRNVCNIVTLPFLRRFGYRLRRNVSRRSA
jgi:hypothetical protein